MNIAETNVITTHEQIFDELVVIDIKQKNLVITLVTDKTIFGEKCILINELLTMPALLIGMFQVVVNLKYLKNIYIEETVEHLIAGNVAE